ncbi:hypothetical protein TL16_g09138 [Triparma laevis f. inornata]|uniref:Uncharacterized protein n=1 Tax=Triparma laevis f. inornata TaxID=1714386 RepID=A0A9W7EKM1_9STRA|nr:hypothetical protein TL16_g09138 [Triparma laevis f. inornata]
MLRTKLRTEKEKNKALFEGRDANRDHYQSVISEINSSSTLQSRRRKLDHAASSGQPLDRDDRKVKRGNNGMLIYDTTTKTVTVSKEIHEEPAVVFESLKTSTLNPGSDTLNQQVLKSSPDETIAYWSFYDQKKFYELLLLLKVEMLSASEIRIGVTSIKEEELDSTCLPVPPPPSSSSTRHFGLILNNGTITLMPLMFGQTSFTFTAQIEVEQLLDFDGNQNRGTNIFTGLTNTSKMKSGSKAVGTKTAKRGALGVNTDRLFCKIIALLYERFKKEDVIDARRTENFIENIDNAPPLTEGERKQIAEAMKLVEEVSSKSKRVAGTVSESVEKFLYKPEGGGGIVGMTVAKMDVSVTRLFAWIWLLDTFTRKAEENDKKIREVWNKNLDGTRSLQCNLSVALPGGFKDRLFESWVTWEELINEEGQRTFIIAFAPMETYEGTHHEVTGAEKMVKATTKGVYIVKELTKNTCECTRVQQVDFKISSALPASVLDLIVKKQLGRANEMQEKFRRNGKEVDKERVAALAGEMIERRGKPLMADQMPVAAWVMDVCSNKGMRRNVKEGGDLARLELREKTRVNERTFATVKKMPFILNNREFVLRFIWKSEEGKVLVALESVDDEFDYGVKLKKTRGFTRGLWQIEDLPVRGGAKQCRVTYVLKLDAGGNIPTWVMDKKMPLALSVVQEAIDEFRQDEKVDAVELEEKATLMRGRWEDEVYSDEEECVLEKGKSTIVAIESSSDLKVIPSGDPLVTIKAAHLEDDKLVTGIIEGVVDGEMEKLAAFDCLKMSREATKNFHKGRGMEKFVKQVNSHRQYYANTRNLKVPGFKHREWRLLGIWKKEGENKMIVCYDDTDALDEEHSRDPNVVAASARTIWEYERLPEVEGNPQTRVKFVARVDVAGGVPNFIMNKLVRSVGKSLINMRKKFDKSLEIDAGRRAVIVKKIKLQEEAGGAEALAQFEALFKEKIEWERPSRSFGMADSKVNAEAFGGRVWGKTSLNVQADMEEVAAFLWDFGSRANVVISGDVERTFEEVDEGGGFKKVVRRRQQLDSAYAGHHHDRSFERTVNAKETVAIRLRRLGGGRTKLEYACDLEIGFGISHRSARHFIERRLEDIAEISIYFQRLVPLVEYTVEDGKTLGHDLLWKAENSKQRVQRLKEVVEKSRALRELSLKYPWMQAMMANILEGSVAMNKAVKTKLICVSEAEGMQMGKNLVPSLMMEQLAEAGVNEWRVQNRAVKELMKDEVWFGPMTIVIGKGIVKSAPWGLMARVIAGAVLSVTDLITDLFVLRQFWVVGEKMFKYRNATLASLATSIILQLLVVLLQNRKKGVRRILKEVAIVIAGMKPAVDAFRVASGAEQEKNTMLDPTTEMTSCKVVEMFAESIPGIVIQTSAIINDLNSGESVSWTIYLSLAVSILATGFVSATLSYDWDTAPKNRAAMPIYYGYIPDSARVRAVMFISLMGISSVKVLLTALLIVCLGSIKMIYVLIFIGFDMLIYLVLKAVRGDFRYWMPVDGLVGLALSLLVGGLYFTLNLFTPVIGLALVLNLMPAETFNEVTAELLTKLAVGLGGGLLFLLGLSFTLMDEKYRKTFLSVETGGQFTRRGFLEGDEIMKSDLIWNNEVQWYPIRGKVEAWIRAGWWRWEEKKPEWFTDDWKANVPKYMIPERGGGETVAVAVEREEKKDVVVGGGKAVVGGGKAQGGRRKSFIGPFINRKENNKVAPDGEQEVQEMDVQEFKREMEWRGSINL